MNNKELDKLLLQKKKAGWGIVRLHSWLCVWNNFGQLDEQIVLAHILIVMGEEKIEIPPSQIRRCFNLHYKREFHSNPQAYLKWLCFIHRKELNNDSKKTLEQKNA